MSGIQRATIAGLAVLIAVVAFLILRPEDEDDNDSKRGTPTAQQAPTTTTPSETEPAPSATPKEPEITTVRVSGGRVKGGVQTIEATEGDTVAFQVISDAEHEIHLHGYDVSKDVTADKPARFELKADQTGIFEIEIEDTKTQIAELKVEP
jgi:FtsP/CotA-like multicopper oxidase with cupredoxin domain